MPRISALVVGLGLLFVSPALSQQTARSNPTQERARVHYRQGWEHMRAEAFDVAAAEFGQAIELYPQYAMDVSYPPYYADLQKIMGDAERQMFGPAQAAPKATLDDAARLMQSVLDQSRQGAGR